MYLTVPKKNKKIHYTYTHNTYVFQDSLQVTAYNCSGLFVIGLGELCWHILSIIVVWKHRSTC